MIKLDWIGLYSVNHKYKNVVDDSTCPIRTTRPDTTRRDPKQLCRAGSGRVGSGHAVKIE